MFPTLPFPLPAAFPKLLTDTPCVGRCFHMDRTVMPAMADQREEKLKSAEEWLAFDLPHTALVLTSATAEAYG